MIHFLFLIAFCYFCPLISQQHDPQIRADEIGQRLTQKGLEYYYQAWELFKKSNPNCLGILGNCLEFSLVITQELKEAQAAYEEFEKTRPNRINHGYTSKRLDLEHKKHILHYAFMVDSEMRATLLNDACTPKATAQPPNR
jgi:hypothetical protein